MDDWNQLADKLEAALLDNTPALMLHFLETATPQQMASVVGASSLNTESKVFASTQAVLAARLEEQTTSGKPS